MTNFLILLVVTLGLSCTKNDSHSIDEENNLNNDSTNVDDSSNLNHERICDSLICSIDSVCLDTSIIQNLTKEELIGTWFLKYFVTLNNCQIDSTPSLQDKHINMTFFENDSISGSTFANTFEAKFNLDSDHINIYNVGFTKICCDPNWMSEFTSFIHSGTKISIKDSTLILYYNNTQKAFLFNK